MWLCSYSIYIYIIFVHIYIYTYIHTYMHTCIHTGRQADRHTYRHTDIHTYKYLYTYIYIWILSLQNQKPVLLSFWDQVWMSPCSWAELVRELRFFWGSSGGDCSGIGLGTAALLALLSWLGGCIFGLICASLVFSHSCRRAYFFLLQSGIALLGPNTSGDIGARAVQLRTRLGQHRACGWVSLGP